MNTFLHKGKFQISKLFKKVTAYFTINVIKIILIVFILLYLILFLTFLYFLLDKYNNFIQEEGTYSITTLNERIHDTYTHYNLNRRYNHPTNIESFRFRNWTHYGNVCNIPLSGNKDGNSAYYHLKVTEDNQKFTLVGNYIKEHINSLNDVTSNFLNITLKLTLPLFAASITLGGIYAYEIISQTGPILA